ncbi:MAG: hypothetical protein AXW15_02285 [Neptuniibacter sp. Phe_28]|nr:MAG: hypothetical protein AXW15_02285 [Neptuniibacter sp. Phe_28]
MGLKAKLMVAGLISLLLLAMSGVIYYLYTQNTQLTADKAKTEHTALQRKLTIQTLEQNAAAKDAALQQLAQQQHALQTQYNHREQTITRLQRENETYRAWAATELPTTVKRLRQRPAITGSSEYGEWLSNTDPLLPTGQPTEPDR